MPALPKDYYISLDVRNPRGKVSAEIARRYHLRNDDGDAKKEERRYKRKPLNVRS